MKTLQIGIENTLTFYRPSPDVTVSSVQIYDTLTGSLLETISSITNDTTSVAVATGADQGDVELTFASAIALNTRFIMRAVPTGSAPDFEIEPITIDAAHKIETKYRLPFDVGAGTLAKGIKSTIVYTPADSTYRTVRVIWILSNDKPISEEYILLKRFVDCPIRSSDIVSRWSRIEGQEPTWQLRAGVSWQPQIDEAWERIREDLYCKNIHLDNIVNSAILRELVMAQTARILTEMGKDPTGGDSRLERLRELERKIEVEMQRIMSAPIVVDANMDNIVTERDKMRKPLRLNFDGLYYSNRSNNDA